jgi:MerR family transcriptional regulator, thiopeptide resistance regulator
VQPAKTGQYRAHECATLAGITVRALHHYDRVGLLRPRRSATGYRLYREADLDTLRLIRILKYVGFSLRRIKTLIAADRIRLGEALRVQQQALQRKRAEVEQSLGTIGDLQRTLDANGDIDSSTRQRIIDTIVPQTAEAKRKRHEYAVAAKIAGVRENIERVRRFAALCSEIERVAGENPSSPRAQAIADRWVEVSAGPGEFDPEVLGAARQMFAQTFADAPDLHQLLPRLMNPAVLGFVQKALDARARAT